MTTNGISENMENNIPVTNIDNQQDTNSQLNDKEYKSVVENNDSKIENNLETEKKEITEEVNDPEIVFNELKSIKESNGKIKVKILSRIRGGYKAIYKGLSVFLPYPQFAIVKNLDEEALNSEIGKEYEVKVIELAEDETKKHKTVIVSRKELLEEEFWNKIKIGDIVEGPVTSVASFGIFIDLGGNEGLIHISRLSNRRIEDTKSFAKKGDIIKARVIEIDRENNRIGLSAKEFADSPWNNIENKYKISQKVKGIVRRIVDFGAYLEIEPGVDALLRNAELSWTKRIKSVSEVAKINDEIEVVINSINPEKQTMSVSLRETQENPWSKLAEKYTLDSEHNGIVKEVTSMGCLVTLNDEVDCFMPRSKMRDVLKGKKIPYVVGNEVKVAIADIDPNKESIILKPVIVKEEYPDEIPVKEKQFKEKPKQEQKFKSNQRDFKEKKEEKPSANAVTLGDMLSSNVLEKLFKN